MKRQKMSIAERIEQELKEIKKSDTIIEVISNKSKNIKKKQTTSSLYFEYMKEMNFLNSKQSKTENEILILLDEIANAPYSDNSRECSFLKEFYELISVEKKIKLEFNKNLKMINNLIANSFKEDLETSGKLIQFLKKFNNDLGNVTEEEENFLLDLDGYLKKNEANELIILEEFKDISDDLLINKDIKNKKVNEIKELSIKINPQNLISNKNPLEEKLKNTLIWFNYENMLQIIEIDPFNVLSIMNIDNFSIQEILLFDNTNYLKDNFTNRKINSNRNIRPVSTMDKIGNIDKDYIFSKENKFNSFLKDIQNNLKAITCQLPEKNDKNNEENIRVRQNNEIIIKEGKFLTEINSLENSKRVEIIYQIIKENLDNLILQFTKIDKITLFLDKKLLERSYLYLGDEETDKILENLNKTYELSYIKYCFDFKELIKGLIQEINKNKKINLKFRKKNLLHNINFLYRSLNLTNDKKDNFFKRLTIEFPYDKREILIDYNNIIDYLYSFRTKKKILLDSYNKEMEELKHDIENIIQESIDSFKKSIMDNNKSEKLNEMKEEMKNLHEKNKEIFILKQKILEEKKKKEKNHLKQELERKEKKLKEYYDEIKAQSEKFKNVKNEKSKIEKMELEREIISKSKKINEELKIKLPLIIQRQAKAENIFIDQYKAQEIKQKKKEEESIRLNQIIENLKVRPKVEIDSNRVKQLTETLKKRYSTKMDLADKVVLFENHGFTVDKLMSDLRYKVTTVLGEAGLLNREYTNDFLRNLHKN